MGLSYNSADVGGAVIYSIGSILHNIDTDLKSSHITRIASILQTVLITFHEEFQEEPKNDTENDRWNSCLFLLPFEYTTNSDKI